jgi:hypothetical protein
MAKLFDPISLMNSEVPKMETRREPLPIGETVATIAEMKFSDGISRKPGKPDTPWHRLDVKLEIEDPDYVAQVPGAQNGKVITFLGIMLDVVNGELAFGPNKNIRLGRLREATDTNGQPLAMMQGRSLKIAISQKPHPTDPSLGNIDEVTSFTKIE